MKNRHVYVDADIVAYLISYQVGDKVDWEDGNGPQDVVNHDQIGPRVLGYVNFLKRRFDTQHVTFCMSDASRHYFRHDIDPNYKVGRTHGEPPAALSFVKDYMRSRPYAVGIARLEADDVVGILATQHQPHEVIIVSSDKDLRQIPGHHYDPMKDKESFVDPVSATLFFFQQAASGDCTDGVCGCPGIGPKRARAAIERGISAHVDAMRPTCNGCKPFEDGSEAFIWAEIVKLYTVKGKDEAFAIQQARLVRILHTQDYDPATTEVRLWTPPKHSSTS